MNVRAVAPLVYAAAVVLAIIVGGGTAVIAVVVVGAMLLGALYVATRPKVPADYDRDAARAARAERRAER